MITIDRQNNKTLYARIKWALLAKGNCSTDSREYVLRLYAHVDEKGYLTTTDGLRLHRVKTDIDAGVYKVMETKDTILLDPLRALPIQTSLSCYLILVVSTTWVIRHTRNSILPLDPITAGWTAGSYQCACPIWS